MSIKILLVVLSLLICLPALAMERKAFKIPDIPTDLIKETNTLKLQEETGVQRTNPPANLFVTFLGGYMQPRTLVVESHGHTVNYNFGKNLPLATVQFSHMLLTKGGKWGWAASAGYSYSQYQGTQATALHMVPVEANLMYRGEWTSTQKLIPYVMAGPATLIYFQRGLDEYNTSQALWMGTATAGAALNLNRLGWVSSRNDAEIVLQYQRTLSRSDSNADLNGNVIQLGGTLAL